MTEIHQEKFEAWLFAQPRERIIEAGDGSCCFICSYFLETTNQKPYINTFTYWSPSGDKDPNPKDITPLPEWARQLISQKWFYHDLNLNRANVSCGLMQDRYEQLFGPICRTEIVAENKPQEAQL